MRLRVVRPDFWSDDTLGRLPDPARLFYIGLWCLADDAGWLEWRPAQIGATLYPYKAAQRRERDVEAWGELLVQSKRLVRHECGCAFIPTLTKHQRQGGNPSFQYRDKHRWHVPADEESRQVHTDTALEKREKSRDSRDGREGAGPGAGPGRADWDQKIVEMRRRGERGAS